MASPSALARIETLVWVYVYAGLFVAGLGHALRRQGAQWGVWLIVVGVVSTLVGVLLVWLRSRMRESPDPERKSP